MHLRRSGTGAIALVAACGALVACGPPLERTPVAPARADASAMRADVPNWAPGDTWHYRGTTFTARDNRFYLRVLRENGGAYEVDTPEYVNFVDVASLRLVRRRNKETGVMSGAFSKNPLTFPLTLSTRFTTTGTEHPEGDADKPYGYACRVVNYEDVEVHAGTFAAFRIDCTTLEGFAEHWYAPAVKNLVKMRWMGKRDTFTAELWDYTLAGR
jgi:hypothetical protein